MTWCDKASKSRFLHRITTKVKSFISAVLIDYTKLGLKHRIMMKLLYSKVVNLDTLEPIVKAL
jgi:hypothetical protein